MIRHCNDGDITTGTYCTGSLLFFCRPLLWRWNRDSIERFFLLTLEVKSICSKLRSQSRHQKYFGLFLWFQMPRQSVLMFCLRLLLVYHYWLGWIPHHALLSTIYKYSVINIHCYQCRLLSISSVIKIQCYQYQVQSIFSVINVWVQINFLEHLFFVFHYCHVNLLLDGMCHVPIPDQAIRHSDFTVKISLLLDIELSQHWQSSWHSIWIKNDGLKQVFLEVPIVLVKTFSVITITCYHYHMLSLSHDITIMCHHDLCQLTKLMECLTSPFQFSWTHWWHGSDLCIGQPASAVAKKVFESMHSFNRSWQHKHDY